MDPNNAAFFDSNFSIHKKKTKDDDDSNIERFVMTVKEEYSFDAELHVSTDSDEFSYFYISPRKIPGEKTGCVAMRFDAKQKVKTIVVSRIVHHGQCTREDSKPLEKKYGTRMMVLGALNVMKSLAAERWPALRSFHLQDESVFACLPLEKAVRTFSTDLFLMDSTYYERHVGFELERADARKSKRALLKRVKRPLKQSYSTFDDFWNTIAPIAIGGSYDGPTTTEKTKWLERNVDEIRRIFSRSMGLNHTGREFFLELHSSFSCDFFASVGNALIDDYKVRELMGAAYKLPFGRLREIDVHTSFSGGSSKIHQISWNRRKQLVELFRRSRMTI